MGNRRSIIRASTWTAEPVFARKSAIAPPVKMIVFLLAICMPMTSRHQDPYAKWMDLLKVGGSTRNTTNFALKSAMDGNRNPLQNNPLSLFRIRNHYKCFIIYLYLLGNILINIISFHIM